MYLDSIECADCNSNTNLYGCQQTLHSSPSTADSTSPLMLEPILTRDLGLECILNKVRRIILLVRRIPILLVILLHAIPMVILLVILLQFQW